MATDPMPKNLVTNDKCYSVTMNLHFFGVQGIKLLALLNSNWIYDLHLVLVGGDLKVNAGHLARICYVNGMPPAMNRHWETWHRDALHKP